MLVREVMSTHLETIAPATAVQECAKKMSELGVGVLPVWQDGQPVGVVTDRDVCCRAVGNRRDLAAMTVRDIMTSDATSCFEDEHCTEAARLMQEKHVRRLTVMNRNHAVVGLFSVDDLARYSHDLAGVVIEAASPWPH